jgi:hypothetical protein
VRSLKRALALTCNRFGAALFRQGQHHCISSHAQSHNDIFFCSFLIASSITTSPYHPIQTDSNRLARACGFFLFCRFCFCSNESNTNQSERRLCIERTRYARPTLAHDADSWRFDRRRHNVAFGLSLLGTRAGPQVGRRILCIFRAVRVAKGINASTWYLCLFCVVISIRY